METTDNDRDLLKRIAAELGVDADKLLKPAVRPATPTPAGEALAPQVEPTPAVEASATQAEPMPAFASHPAEALAKVQALIDVGELLPSSIFALNLWISAGDVGPQLTECVQKYREAAPLRRRSVRMDLERDPDAVLERLLLAEDYAKHLSGLAWMWAHRFDRATMEQVQKDLAQHKPSNPRTPPYFDLVMEFERRDYARTVERARQRERAEQL